MLGRPSQRKHLLGLSGTQPASRYSPWLLHAPVLAPNPSANLLTSFLGVRTQTSPKLNVKICQRSIKYMERIGICGYESSGDRWRQNNWKTQGRQQRGTMRVALNVQLGEEMQVWTKNRLSFSSFSKQEPRTCDGSWGLIVHGRLRRVKWHHAFGTTFRSSWHCMHIRWLWTDPVIRRGPAPPLWFGKWTHRAVSRRSGRIGNCLGRHA